MMEIGDARGIVAATALPSSERSLRHMRELVRAELIRIHARDAPQQYVTPALLTAQAWSRPTAMVVKV